MSDSDLRALERAAETGSVESIFALEAAYERLGRPLDAHRLLLRHSSLRRVEDRLLVRWPDDRRMVGLRSKPRVVWERRFEDGRAFGEVYPQLVGTLSWEVTDLRTGAIREQDEGLQKCSERRTWEWESLVVAGRLVRNRMNFLSYEQDGEDLRSHVQGHVIHGPPENQAVFSKVGNILYCYRLVDIGLLVEWTHALRPGEWVAYAAGGAKETLLRVGQGLLGEKRLSALLQGKSVAEPTQSIVLLRQGQEAWRSEPLEGHIAHMDLTIALLCDSDGWVRRLRCPGEPEVLHRRLPGPVPGLDRATAPLSLSGTSNLNGVQISRHHVCLWGEGGIVVLRRPELDFVGEYSVAAREQCVALGDHELYVGTPGGVRAVDLETLEVLWEFDTSGVSEFDPSYLEVAPEGLLVMLGDCLIRLGQG